MSKTPEQASPKGILECGVGRCKNAAHPLCYNRVTQWLYCYECAFKIEKARRDFHPDWEPFYPWLKLAKDAKRNPTEGGSYVGGTILVREGKVT